ncbi:MAG TPA: UxaA family hydrolase [Bordetella sp.]|jgi:altronate dehydratase small subunit|nr:UxaA family hydrolase [Bordetella sp.]
MSKPQVPSTAPATDGGDAKIWVVHRDDNVGTVVGGDVLAAGPVPLAGSGQGRVDVAEPVPYGHKVALRQLAAGEEIIKYGVAVGRLSGAVAAGRHVHVHNLESQRGRGDLAGPC